MGRAPSFVHHCDDDDHDGRDEKDEVVWEPPYSNTSNIVEVGNS